MITELDMPEELENRDHSVLPHRATVDDLDGIAILLSNDSIASASAECFTSRSPP